MPSYRAVHHRAPFLVGPSTVPHTDLQDTVKARPASTTMQRQKESAKSLRRRTCLPTAQSSNVISATTTRKPPSASDPLRPNHTPGTLLEQYNSRYAAMQQLRVARARRRMPHSSQNPNGYLNTDGMDDYDYDYATEHDTGMDWLELEEARHLTTAVRSTAVGVMKTGAAVFTQLQQSVAGLQELLANCGPVGCTTISQSIATRMETLSQVRDLQIQAAKARDLLVESCHHYRSLVRVASGAPNDVSGVLFALYRRKLLLRYHEYLIKGLVKELKADARDPALDAIPGFDAALLRKRLSTHNNIFRTAFPQITISTGVLDEVLLIEVGGEGLGILHANQFWRSDEVNKTLRKLHGLRKQHTHESRSHQYRISMTKSLSDIDTLLSILDSRLGILIVDVKHLDRDLRYEATAAGRAGALEPFADLIRKKAIELLRSKYHREYRIGSREHSIMNQLRIWGYLPSTWCKSMWGAKSINTSPRSVRTKYRSKRRAYIDGLSARLHVTYYLTTSASIEPWAPIIKTPARKPKRIVRPRTKLKKERGIALKKIRRLLSATLLLYQSRTIKSWRSVDRLASLPETERPSPLTQAGKTIAALGFYDKLDKKSSWLGKEELLRKDSGKPIVRWIDSKAKPMRVPPLFRPRFQASQPMRAPHSTSTPFSGDAWEQSVSVLTNADTNGRRSLDSESLVFPISGGTSGASTDTKHLRGDSSGEQRPKQPNDPPDGQKPQPPNESMDKPMNDDPPHESEQEEESQSEVDEDSATEESEEDHTPLTYQIPSVVMETALRAPPQTRASYWSQKLYRGPEDEELLLHYCANMEVSERVAKHFLNEKVLGFDIEWKPFGTVDSIKENASLIQLATEDRIALFHIARFPGKTPEQLMPPTLKAVLEDPNSYKVGVAVKGDCRRLEKYFNLNVRGVFELSRLHNLVEYYGTQPSKVNNKLVKLSTQVHQHLLLPLHKGEPFAEEPQQRLSSVRESDWSRPLDFEQIHYAAADAYAGFRLFDVMESKRKKLKPTPPMPRLCDYDNKPAPRTTPRAKRAKKVTPELEKVVAESLSGLQAEDAEEEEYETAAEELGEEEESEDTDSEAASEPSENEDPDADYVPKARGRMTDVPATPEASAHRIGRIAFSKLNGIDPAYPTLPFMSAEEDVSSDESEAYDPPPKVPRRRRVAKAAKAADVLPAKLADSDDKFPDPELEQAFASTDLSEPLKTIKNPVTESSPQPELRDLESLTEQAPVEEDSPALSDISPPAFTPIIQADTTTRTSEYILATTWAQTYLSSTIPSPSSIAPSRVHTTVSPLRAYHIWHHQRVPLDAIGAHLRDPPLAQSTVSSYILQAINMEKLEYRDEDLISLMGALPANLRLGRYEWLSRKLGILR